MNPDDMKLYFLGRPADAFNVMREKGLGITNENLNKIPVFEKYKEQYKKSTKLDLEEDNSASKTFNFIIKPFSFENTTTPSKSKEFLLDKYIIKAPVSTGMYIKEFLVDIDLDGINIDEVKNLKIDDLPYINSPKATNNKFSLNEYIAPGSEKIISIYAELSQDVISVGRMRTKISALSEGELKNGGATEGPISGPGVRIKEPEITISLTQVNDGVMLSGVEEDVFEIVFESKDFNYEVTEIEIGAFDKYGKKIAENAVSSLKINNQGEVVDGITTVNKTLFVKKDNTTKVYVSATPSKISDLNDSEIQFGVINYKYNVSGQEYKKNAKDDDWFIVKTTGEVLTIYSTSLALQGNRGCFVEAEPGLGRFDFSIKNIGKENATINQLKFDTLLSETHTNIEIFYENGKRFAVSDNGRFSDLSKIIKAGEVEDFYGVINYSNETNAPFSYYLTITEWNDGTIKRDGSLIDGNTKGGLPGCSKPTVLYHFMQQYE